MSRVRVFGLNNKSRGEFTGRLSRGWSLVGAPGIRGGGQTSLAISTDIAALNYLQLGRMILVEQEGLPAWAGVIDPDWRASGTPSLTVYNVEYMLSLRTPDDIETITGQTRTIIARLLEIGNEQEEMFFRMGETDEDPMREATIDRRTIWEQIKELVERAGMELEFRPQISDGRLWIYLDIQKKGDTGRNTRMLYHDGDNANMVVRSARVSRQIVNRVVGVNDASSEEDRLVTDPILDETSIKNFRLRSQAVQFQGVTEMSVLEAQANEYLDAYSWPQIEMTVAVRDEGQAFRSARLGNTAIYHASNVRLPGGVHGFRGSGRILAMAYDEPANLIGLTVMAEL